MKTAYKLMLMIGALSAQQSLQPALSKSLSSSSSSSSPRGTNEQILKQIREIRMQKQAQLKKRSFIRRLIIGATSVAALGATVAVAYHAGYTLDDLNLSERYKEACEKAYVYWQSCPTKEALYTMITEQWSSFLTHAQICIQEKTENVSSFIKETGNTVMTQAQALNEALPTPDDLYKDALHKSSQAACYVKENGQQFLNALKNDVTRLSEKAEPFITTGVDLAKKQINQLSETVVSSAQEHAHLLQEKAHTLMGSTLVNAQEFTTHAVTQVQETAKSLFTRAAQSLYSFWS